MSIWIVEPLDPLIARDGRPFSNTPGARAKSLPFPFPSTTAGGVRTRAGQDGDGLFDKDCVSVVRDVRVRGPLLGIREGDAVKLLVPAPLDAVVFDADKQARTVQRRHLAPIDDSGAEIGMPSNVQYLVGMPNAKDDKPSKNAPRYWHWDMFVDWLLAPSDDATPQAIDVLGCSGPTPDRRVHVQIAPGTQTALEGALFTTSGLTFWDNATAPQALSGAQKLVLITAVDNLNDLTINPGYGALGGERRIMHWQRGDDTLLPQTAPDDLVKQVAADGHCRVVLLTPAHFDAGWQPDWLCQPRHGVTPDLQAALVGQPAVVSGWDFEHGQPKPTRRLAPSGSVFYLKLNGTSEAIEAWIKDIWLQCISDNDDDRKAGFGLAAVGTWSGTPATIQFDKEEINA